MRYEDPFAVVADNMPQRLGNPGWCCVGSAAIRGLGGCGSQAGCSGRLVSPSVGKGAIG